VLNPAQINVFWLEKTILKLFLTDLIVIKPFFMKGFFIFVKKATKDEGKVKKIFYFSSANIIIHRK